MLYFIISVGDPSIHPPVCLSVYLSIYLSIIKRSFEIPSVLGLLVTLKAWLKRVLLMPSCGSLWLSGDAGEDPGSQAAIISWGLRLPKCLISWLSPTGQESHPKGGT